jgi:hypothetical protein
MHRNIVRAYNCLQDEHNRLRAACFKSFSRNDKDPEQELLRANLDSLRHHDKMLLYGRKGEGGVDFGAGVEFADQMIEL